MTALRPEPDRGGRPPLDAEGSPTVGLHLRISAADRDLLRRAADASGQSLSELVRAASIARARRVLGARR